MSMYSDSVRAFLRPINPLLDDPEISEVLVHGPQEVWIERGGKISRAEASFTEDSLQAAVRNIAQYVGRVLNDERPRLDARLPDGSRIHIVLAPVARKGTLLAIRKFAKDKLSMQRLIEVGASTPQLARLVEACIELKLNVIVSGGSGSGKTTLLNVVSRFIPEDERIVTIEDSAELQLQQPHVLGLESRPPDKFGKGEVTLEDLLASALRIRPDRIVVGEVRGGEAFYLLQAMNTGHGGTLATTHANTPTDTLRRLESLCLLAGIDLPMVAVRAQVASAINVIICCERLQDGSRKITHVSEVLPLNDRGEYRTQDLWVYTQTGRTANGRVEGYHAPTGILPTFMHQLKAHGLAELDERFFDPATYKLKPPPLFHVDGEQKTRWAPSLRHRENGLEEAPVEPNADELAPAPAPAPAAAAPITSAPIAAPTSPVAAPAIAIVPTAPTEPASRPSDETVPAATAPGQETLPEVALPAEPAPTLLTETPLPGSVEIPLRTPRSKEPEPAEVPPSLLTEDTPKGGVESPFSAESSALPEDTDPGLKQQLALADAPKSEPAKSEPAKTEPAKTEPAKSEPAKSEPAKSEPATADAAKPVSKPPPPPKPKMVDEPTIQIADDLLEEVERAVSNEATYVKRNPLLGAAKPPVARPPQRGNARPPPPPRRSEEDENEKTDPHIRIPTK